MGEEAPGKKSGDRRSRTIPMLSQQVMVLKTFRFPLSFPTSLFFRLRLERISKEIKIWDEIFNCGKTEKVQG